MLVMGGAETHRKNSCVILGPAVSVVFSSIWDGAQHQLLNENGVKFLWLECS